MVAILNNGFLGMVRQWQDLFWNKRYSHTCIAVQPDFAKLAEAFGAFGATVTGQGRGGRRAARGDRGRPAGGDRLRGAPRRERLSDGAVGRPPIMEMIGGAAAKRGKP